MYTDTTSASTGQSLEITSLRTRTRVRSLAQRSVACSLLLTLPSADGSVPAPTTYTLHRQLRSYRTRNKREHLVHLFFLFLRSREYPGVMDDEKLTKKLLNSVGLRNEIYESYYTTYQ